MIRDEVVLTEIMEQAGQKLLNREARGGPIDQLYGFAWVTVYRVAISRLRRSPYLLEQPTTDSAERALSRLTSDQSSPASIERGVLASQVLDRLSPRNLKSRSRQSILRSAGFGRRCRSFLNQEPSWADDICILSCGRALAGIRSGQSEREEPFRWRVIIESVSPRRSARKMRSTRFLLERTRIRRGRVALGKMFCDLRRVRRCRLTTLCSNTWRGVPPVIRNSDSFNGRFAYRLEYGRHLPPQLSF